MHPEGKKKTFEKKRKESMASKKAHVGKTMPETIPYPAVITMMFFFIFF